MAMVTATKQDALREWITWTEFAKIAQDIKDQEARFNLECATVLANISFDSPNNAPEAAG